VTRDSELHSSSGSIGRFIVFEGGDGSGKSTQAKLLAEQLGAVLTREPGGTKIGAKIRDLVLDPTHSEMSDRTEALLMAADRAQHVHERIRPALLRGQHVVSDRHVASSLAYQGVGRGLGIDVIADVNAFAVDTLAPDLIVLLEADPRAARDRLGADLDRIEHAGTELAEVVATTYRSLAAADPSMWAVIDASGSVDDVAARVANVMNDRLGL
jgi:dTMP kinase